ncbi:MAG: glutamyl-tRNA reductase [Gaiellaceae bacterium]|jgi:glutamyl-tRNA reductase|nr:glutamyl-tRNA reductase [Gaiellaceae bacterium]
MTLTLAGVSHHRAPIELRELVALDLDACRALAQRLAERLDGEAVVLSTCNRTEVYLVRDEHAEDVAVDTLVQLAGDRADDLAAALYRLRDEAAALHLFRVAAGLDSLVPGEGEILGQVRTAFEAGSAGPFLDRLFRQALHTGKRVRMETAIGESPASVPSAAAALAQQVFGELTGRRVLVLGAGKMSEATARNLRSRGAEIAIVANRTLAHGEDLARKVGAQALALDAVAAELEHADVVVSATSASELVLSRESVAAALRSRKGRPLLLVDLAVPRDLDPAINELEGCFLYDVDDLEAVVAETLSGRRGEATRAEQLVAGEADRFREWQASLDVVPTIASLRALAEEIRDRELLKAGGRLSERERKHVESVTSQIVAKLLHLPTIRMKEAAAAADGVVYADVVKHLFGLEEEDRRR